MSFFTLQQLLSLKEEKGTTYVITAKAGVKMEESPHNLKIDDDTDHDEELTENELNELNQEVKHYLMSNLSAHKKNELHDMGITIVDIEVKKVWLGIEDFLKDMESNQDKFGDGDADKDDGFDNKTFGDSMGSSYHEQISMDYYVNVLVTLAPGEKLTQEASDYIGNEVTDCIWDESNKEGEVETEFNG